MNNIGDELLIQGALNKIRTEMDRLYWNKYQKIMSSPFDNTGEIYENKVFKVRAYCWNEDTPEWFLPNFEYKDLKCYWYKHSNRGFNWDYEGEQYRRPSSKFLSKMLEDCFEAMAEDFRVK